MKKIIYIIITISSFVLFSCHNECSVDKEFEREFNNCILLIRNIHTEGYASSMRERAVTYECLYAITGYAGHVDKDNEPHYFSEYSDSVNYIIFDIDVWNKWYELNKCKMTKLKADSIIKQHGNKIGFKDLKWPSKLD